MTDEERKALVINLRWLGKLDYEPEIANPCLKAADEIERLAKDNRILWDLLRPQMGQSEDAKRKEWS